MMKEHIRHCSVVVITSASHAEGPQFEPGQCQFYFKLKKARLVSEHFKVANFAIFGPPLETKD
jgi:hypothetical protein